MPEELKKGAVKPNAQASPGPIGNTQGIIVPKTATHPDGDSAPKPQPQPKEEGWWKRWGSDWTHTALDVVGLIPVAGELSDGANALIYLAEGDKINAAISLTAMVPLAGDAVTAGKWAMKGVKKIEKEAMKEAEEAAAKKLAKEAEEAAAKKAAKEAEEKAAKGGYVDGPKDKMSKGDQMQANKKKGDEFANQEIENFKSQADKVEKEITIKASDGTKTRVDAIGVNKQTGKIEIKEYKSSETAPFTKNQGKAFPQIGETGGEIVGKGKGDFLGGTKIPPTEIKIIRPPTK